MILYSVQYFLLIIYKTITVKTNIYSVLYIGVGASRFDILKCMSNPPAVCCKGNDCFSVKEIFVEQSFNSRSKSIPPYRSSEINRVIFGKISVKRFQFWHISAVHFLLSLIVPIYAFSVSISSISDPVFFLYHLGNFPSVSAIRIENYDTFHKNLSFFILVV